MNIGQLRHRVSIEQPVYAAADANGEKAKTYTTFTRLWADVQPLTGRQYEMAKTFGATVTHKVVTRYVPGIEQTMRVNFNGRYLSVAGVINVDERNRELNLVCIEQK